METGTKRKIQLSGKVLLAFCVLLGTNMYFLSGGTSTASESRDTSLVSAVTMNDPGVKNDSLLLGLLKNNQQMGRQHRNDQGRETDARFEGSVPFRVSFDSRKFVGPMESYTWNFGDGEMAQGRLASHLFVSEGTYSVTLTAKQKTGQVRKERLTVLVTAKK